MESAIFRDYFLLLRGRSIYDAMGVEVIDHRVDGSTKATESHRCSTRSTNPMLSEGNGQSSSTAITVDNCWRDDIVDVVSGNVEANDAKGKKRDHHEMSSTTTTSNDKATNNQKGSATTMTTTVNDKVNNKKPQLRRQWKVMTRRLTKKAQRQQRRQV
jgi:hypothetical protein